MSFPLEIITDPEEKIVYVTPEVDRAFPGAVEAFDKVDLALINGPDTPDTYNRKFIIGLSHSVFTFRSSTGAYIDASILPGNGSELLVMWAPFSDSAPRSSGNAMYNYISGYDLITNRSQAAPNSWNQLTKSSVVSELLKAVDREMPVLTIFSPLPSVPRNAYTREENREIRQGDFTSSGRIVEEAVKITQDRLHGPKSETQLGKFHFHGGSLGASSAIGAAADYIERGAVSVTAQELIVAPKNLGSLGLRFTIKSLWGEPSQIEVDDQLPKIYEPRLRQRIEREGNEFMMNARLIQGMSKLSRLQGLTQHDRNQTPSLIDDLLDYDISVMIPLAENSGLTHDTPSFLPYAGEHLVKVKAVKGERTGHLIDEHVGLTALLAVMHIQNS